MQETPTDCPRGLSGHSQFRLRFQDSWTGPRSAEGVGAGVRSRCHRELSRLREGRQLLTPRRGRGRQSLTHSRQAAPGGHPGSAGRRRSSEAGTGSFRPNFPAAGADAPRHSPPDPSAQDTARGALAGPHRRCLRTLSSRAPRAPGPRRSCVLRVSRGSFRRGPPPRKASVHPVPRGPRARDTATLPPEVATP